MLLVAYTLRIAGYCAGHAEDPSRGFGYFSIVAAAIVIAVRFGLAGHAWA